MLLLYSLQEIHLFSRLELLMCSTPAFEPSSSPYDLTYSHSFFQYTMLLARFISQSRSVEGRDKARVSLYLYSSSR